MMSVILKTTEHCYYKEKFDADHSQGFGLTICNSLLLFVYFYYTYISAHICNYVHQNEMNLRPCP